MKNYVQSKLYEPTVQEFELIPANPGYALVRLSKRKGITVSLRHLTPAGEGNKIFESEAVTIASNRPISYSDQSHRPNSEATVPKLVSNDSIETAEPGTCNFHNTNTAKMPSH